MIKTVLVTLLLLAAGYYSYFLLRVRRGIQKLRAAGVPQHRPRLSVIIAARNEESHIQTCLDSVLAQDYPAGKFEVIIVDDGSLDRTPDIVQSTSLLHDNVLLLRASSMSQESEEGKPRCIAQGVRESNGEIILLTDADCVVPPTWMSNILSYFEEDVALVAGPVLEASESGVFSRLQSVEYLGLTTTAAGLIGSGQPIICSGANLAYRKSAFEEVDGFGSHGTSCDDETLMQRINLRGVGRVKFAADPRAIVITRSDHSLSSFWNRRTRWASKRGHYEDKSILFSLITLYLFFLMLTSVLVVSFFIPELLPFAALVLIWKVIIDYGTILAGAKKFGVSFSWLDFLIAELFHVPYIVLATAVGQILPVRWKGRTHQR